MKIDFVASRIDTKQPTNLSYGTKLNLTLSFKQTIPKLVVTVCMTP